MIRKIVGRIKVWNALRRGYVHWHDIQLFFPPRSPSAAHLAYAGEWERSVSDVAIAAARDGTTIFDIGANIGAFVPPLLANFKTSKIVSFEPSPITTKFLQRTRDNSQFADRWEIVAKAVTSGPEKQVQFVTTANDLFDGLRDTGRAQEGQVTSVQATTLDAEWDARLRPEVSLIKIDVEGGELGVLGGAVNCIASCRPKIIMEWCSKNFACYGHKSSDVVEVASRMKYDVYVLPELSPLADYRLVDIQLATRENLLLVPQDPVT